MSERIPVIEAKNLVKTYGEGEGLMYALNDVSVTVYEHDFLVILGGSGSGKSTLLNMIGAIDKVDSGEIIVNNRDIVKLNDKGLTLYRRNEVGFVYQFFNLINDVTVYQNVTLAPGSRNKERALRLLDRVGLLEKKDKFPRQLSGGQQQRVAIARALNKESNILLCDEPTGALDSKTGASIIELLNEVAVEYKKTVILVTHNSQIAECAERLIRIRDGKIETNEIVENPLKPSEVKW